MRHKLAVAVLCALFLFPALGLGEETQGEGGSGEGMFRWKMATLAPKNLGWAQQVRAIILPWTKRNTDNNLRWKIYYGGIMGNDEDYLRKIHIGQLQGAGVSGHGSNLACPEFSVLGLPFLFSDWEEVDYVRAVMFPTFDEFYEKYGYKLLLWIDQDFDQIYSAKWRFDNLDDFKKSRFQGWYGPQETAMLKALGATPIPMPPTEANTGYRTGIVDSNIGPAIFQVGSQMYTSCRFINTMKTRYAPAALIVDIKKWKELPVDYQKRIEAERAETQTQFCIETRKDNERCIDGMIRYGLEPVKMTPEAVKAITARAMTIYDDLSGTLYPPALLTEVRRYLADFRRQRGKAAPRVAKAEPAARPAVESAPVTEPVAEAKPEAMPMMEAKPEAMPMMEAKPEAKPEAAPMMEAKPEAKPEAAPMMEAKPEAAPEAASWKGRKRQIAEVQTALKSLGLYAARIDGLYGPITRKGIKGYQEKNGLAVTGTITGELLDHMKISR